METMRYKMKKDTSTRRKALKVMAAGSGAIIAGKSMPESWSKPVIDTVLLPTHAATTDDTGSLPAGTVICASMDVAAGARCEGGSISFSVSGSVSASDGSSLEGVELTVAYTNEAESGGSPESKTVMFSVLIAAGNVFSSPELTATPPAGYSWFDPEATVEVSFADSAYGASSCSTVYRCGRG